MKRKLLWALTCLVVGLAAFTGKVAYADRAYEDRAYVGDRAYVSMYEEPAYCADLSFNDPTCSAYLTRSSGKAAFGESTEKSWRPDPSLNFCEDWSFNTPGCPAYLPRSEGKAAYGEAAMPLQARQEQPDC